MAAAPHQVTSHINQITRQIITSAMKVHTVLGPGLLESAYQACLVHELRKHNLMVASQVGLPVVYEGERLTSDTGSISLSKAWSLSRSSALRQSILCTKPSYFLICASAEGRSAC